MRETDVIPKTDDPLATAKLNAVILRARYRYLRALAAVERIAADTRTCATCRKPLKGKRADAVTCSNKCRLLRLRRAKGVRERQAFLRARRAERKARKECAGADQHT